jgi:hypothetical protein
VLMQPQRGAHGGGFLSHHLLMPILWEMELRIGAGRAHDTKQARASVRTSALALPFGILRIWIKKTLHIYAGEILEHYLLTFRIPKSHETWKPWDTYNPRIFIPSKRHINLL